MLSPDEQRRDGLAIIDKPAGWTSHDVVAKARGLLRNKKIGHSGTLDPDATGVLLLGVGRVTRLLRFLTALPKTYTGEFVLGIETSTLDASGEVVATHDMSAVRPEDVERGAVSLTGDILQVPPMVSAVRVGGKRLHQLAREGKEVDRDARPVSVYRFEVEADLEDPAVYRFEVDVLVGHLCAFSRSRPGARAGRRCPPAIVAAHGHRIVHRGRGAPARGSGRAATPRGPP